MNSVNSSSHSSGLQKLAHAGDLKAPLPGDETKGVVEAHSKDSGSGKSQDDAVKVELSSPRKPLVPEIP